MMALNKIKSLIKKIINLIGIKLVEKNGPNKLKYIYHTQRENKKLIIVFSGFGSNGERRYNYMRGFRNIKADKLYILDNWGNRGSYYLFENGENTPETATEGLIKKIIESKNYEQIYTAGSSKGGTAAIYFGLKFNAKAIFSGACQFFLGKYLTRPEHKDIFIGMMGKDASTKEIDILDNIIKKTIIEHKGSPSELHIVYSKNEAEKTYQDETIFLLETLHSNGYKVIEKEEIFDKHSQIGTYFIKYVNDYFNSIN